MPWSPSRLGSDKGGTAMRRNVSEWEKAQRDRIDMQGVGLSLAMFSRPLCVDMEICIYSQENTHTHM